MKFSTHYIIYPENRALERAIASSIGLLSEDAAAAAVPDTKVAVADNFLYTRGNYEQHRFSSRIFENLREALEASLTDTADTAADPAAKINRAREPLAWAETQNNLGNILRHWVSSGEMLNRLNGPSSASTRHWRYSVRRALLWNGPPRNTTWARPTKRLVA